MPRKSERKLPRVVIAARVAPEVRAKLVQMAKKEGLGLSRLIGRLLAEA